MAVVGYQLLNGLGSRRWHCGACAMAENERDSDHQRLALHATGPVEKSMAAMSRWPAHLAIPATERPDGDTLRKQKEPLRVCALSGQWMARWRPWRNRRSSSGSWHRPYGLVRNSAGLSADQTLRPVSLAAPCVRNMADWRSTPMRSRFGPDAACRIRVSPRSAPRLRRVGQERG